MRIRFVQKSILPGFGLTMGFTLLYLSVIVLIPLAAVALKATGAGWAELWNAVSSDRVLASFRVTILASFAAAIVNVVFGFLVAWVLTRYSFPGKRFVDGLIDLPFALPTAVAGISLTAIYSQNGWIGQWLEPLGIKVAFTPIGITVALIFIGLPFVVRTVQPVIGELEKEIEEAAVSLGAKRWLTFRKVLFPELLPPLLTGFALAFSRSIGEYGSVVFISGNMPMKTEIVPLLIMTKLEQYDYTGATAIALMMLVFSFLLLLLINVLQWFSHRRFTTK
ncbi:sulfate ABC transporter permease subunit CysT [Paenibacillus antri]|uniref:Sulfate transport system permease protein CysT n=1 Tax=Paenibacillus antri TaxID=2582848 RepID=A0A5R9G7R8_9BACL|nr:sulfate ABC transporter permease subunit CysT [Paenibacillus antri]TLS51119.1 sulfate ABC transporter permease subunit CysT [Paenibacillus antri]